MPKAIFESIRIAGLHVCVGPEVRKLDDLAELCNNEPAQLQRLRKMTGIEQRRVAPVGITTLDLGESAAKALLCELNIAAESIDAILFVTQSPDHWQPCNANLLHGRLGCRKSTAAMDINQGCSGWVYGLYMANCMLTAGGCQRVLMLAGDTVSQSIHPEDRAVLPLFGDACAATVIEKSDSAGRSWFSLHSDGSGHAAISIPAGGYRRPLDESTSIPETDADGNVRTPANLHMNGLEVFNFTLREEPQAINELLEYSGQCVAEVDYFVFHQASRFILDNLTRKLKLPAAKVAGETLTYYGNQSSASIPAGICEVMEKAQTAQNGSVRLLCSGFGVGLSWASCLLEVPLNLPVKMFSFKHSK
jgi:3-oxoacyl-[acyl-carrier-protein] synthase-3